MHRAMNVYMVNDTSSQCSGSLTWLMCNRTTFWVTFLPRLSFVFAQASMILGRDPVCGLFYQQRLAKSASYLSWMDNYIRISYGITDSCRNINDALSTSQIYEVKAWIAQKAGSRFDIKMPSYQYRKSHCRWRQDGRKIVLSPQWDSLYW